MSKQNHSKQSLFSEVNGHTIPNPKNQYALVLHTLMENPKGITQLYWANHYNILKFATRLGELETKLSKILVKKEPQKFTNRFGHEGQYVLYTPILTIQEYLEIYNKINK